MPGGYGQLVERQVRRRTSPLMPRGDRRRIARSVAKLRKAARNLRVRALLGGVTRGVKEELSDWAAKFYADPVQFAEFAFPWGVPGTELEHIHGLRTWQKDYLRWLGEQVRSRGFDGVEPVAPIRRSLASGHGIGKSALVAIVILWLMVTRPFCKGTVTATTNAQLRVKTWAELAKWHSRCIYASWFEVGQFGALYIRHKSWPANWRCDGQTCAEHNSEAFAGQHEVSSSSFYIFDEASGVPNKIWEVAMGGLTDGEPFFLAFGNPTQSGGQFAYTQGRDRDYWNAIQIDSRDVEGTNKQLFNEWAELYGEDSDFFRVRVRGLPPRQAAHQFIPTDYVERAAQRVPPQLNRHPVLLGVDVARGESEQANKSAARLRQGVDASSFPTFSWEGVDNVQLAGLVADVAERFNVDAILVDSTGVGGGVYDILKRSGWPVYGVVSGGRADDPIRYANKRAECWGEMLTWLQEEGCLPEKDTELHEQLTGIWSYLRLNGQRIMEAKLDMEERGLKSPDDADALSFTFARRFPADYRSRRLAGLPGITIAGDVKQAPARGAGDADYDPRDLLR